MNLEQYLVAFNLSYCDLDVQAPVQTDFFVVSVCEQNLGKKC